MESIFGDFVRSAFPHHEDPISLPFANMDVLVQRCRINRPSEQTDGGWSCSVCLDVDASEDLVRMPCCRQTIGTKCLQSWLHDTAAVANGRCAHCRAQLLHSTPISRQRHRAWTNQQRQHLQDLESEMLGYEVVQTEDGERRIYNSSFQPRGITSWRSGSRHNALLERDPLRENAIPWPPAFGLGTQQVATSHATGSRHRRLNRHLLREPLVPVWDDSDALRFSFQEGELLTLRWNANPVRRDLHPSDP